jgi:hypothetical protein
LYFYLAFERQISDLSFSRSFEDKIESLSAYVEKRKRRRRIYIPGRSFRPSETAPYTAGNGYKTAKILPETAKNWDRFLPFFTGFGP